MSENEPTDAEIRDAWRRTDTANHFLVTSVKGMVPILRFNQVLTPAEAINLAAWLFVMSGATTTMAGLPAVTLDEFRALMEAIQNT